MALTGLAKSDACSRESFPLEANLDSISESFSVSRLFSWITVIGSGELQLERAQITIISRKERKKSENFHSLSVNPQQTSKQNLKTTTYRRDDSSSILRVAFSELARSVGAQSATYLIQKLNYKFLK